MKIVMLAENTAINENLISMHGLSLYIETLNHKVLIDFGDKDIFLHNSLRLGVNISDVDIAIITHGHNDHGGGLKCFLENNRKAKIYIQERAFLDYFVITKAAENYIGLEKKLKDNPQIVLVDGDFKINDELTLIANPKITAPAPAFNSYLYEKVDGILKPDKFLHEQSVIISDNKTLLVGGCAHSGIVNIINDALSKLTPAVKIDYCISGFHLFNPGLNLTDFEAIEDLSEKLLQTGIKIYTCHCTGTAAFEKLKESMGENIEYLSTGSILKI